MALRGNLRDFSLPDVFQLVTLSGKSGVLRIKRSDDAEGAIWFRDGEVFFAQSNWQRDPLGERMVEAGRLTPNALAKALGIQQSEGHQGRRLGQILIDEGYVTDKVLEAFVQEQIQDTIFDLMRWDEGDFHFDPLDTDAGEDIGLSVSIENIVMEGSRRLEEWNRIKKKIPSTDMVFKMATAPGEGTFEISLKPIEWNLLLLVDGTRNVSELASDTGGTDFEVARVIYGLFSAGLLEVASDDEVERLRAERAQLESRYAREDASVAPAEVPPSAPVSAPAPAPEPQAAEPAPRPAPEAAHEPDLPAFLSDQQQSAASVEDMVVFEQMLGAVLTRPEDAAPTPAPTEAPPTPAPEPEPEPEPAPIDDVLMGLTGDFPVPPVAEAAEEPVVVEPMGVREPGESEEPDAPQRTGDFARDLMALGLGELPTEDLLTPMGDETAAEEADVLAAETEEVLGELLGSLEAVEEPVVEPEVEEAATPEAGGVISTDAFMAEFEDGDFASRGLGDELTALTGGGMVGGRQRPSATVNKIPESGQEQAGLHMDRHVDKDLVLKIIEGIEKL